MNRSRLRFSILSHAWSPLKLQYFAKTNLFFHALWVLVWDCFILCPTEKVILWVVLVNGVIQEWAITYTNMTQNSFWPKPNIFSLSGANRIHMMETSASSRPYICSLQAFYHLQCAAVPCLQCSSDSDTSGRARSSHYTKHWIFNGSLQPAIFRHRFCQSKQVEKGSVRSTSAQAKSPCWSHLYPVCQLKTHQRIKASCCHIRARSWP